MRSMTAYASVHEHKNAQGVQIAVRSINFKYLDIIVRNVPAENILLEEEIKREIKKKIYRGKVEVFVFSTRQPLNKISIDEAIVARYVAQARSLAKKYKLKSDLGISDILNLPQAVSFEQKPGGDRTIVISALKKALDKLLEFKEKEGKIIRKEISKNLQGLKQNIQRIRKHKPGIREMENGKEDIDEELSLISFYVNKLESNIQSKKAGPKGKSLDFLTQEILRELNAASSKTRKRTPALLIVEAKNYLERIREQVQNIE